jgi:hypothetical protein
MRSILRFHHLCYPVQTGTGNLGIPQYRLSDIINRKRGISADTELLFSFLRSTQGAALEKPEKIYLIKALEKHIHKMYLEDEDALESKVLG